MPTNSGHETLEEALRLSLQRQGAIARFGTRALVAIDLAPCFNRRLRRWLNRR